MPAAALDLLGAELADMGLLDSAAGALPASSADLASASRILLGRCRGALDGDPSDWTAARAIVAAYQLVLMAEGLDPGPMNGVWNAAAAAGHRALALRRRNATALD